LRARGGTKKGCVCSQGIASFIELATSAGICIANSEKILRNAKTEDFDKIVEHLLTKANARGVIMFVDEDNTRYKYTKSEKNSGIMNFGYEKRKIKEQNKIIHFQHLC
jgi:hypothetical protein